MKVHCSAKRSLVETLQWVEHEQTWPFLRCHLELSLPSVLGPSKPHLQSLLSQSQGKGQLSLTGIPSGLSVREEMVTWAARADTHLKPSQFNEAQHVDSNKSCLSLSPLTEPLPSFVGWDYSAGGARDGAGKNLSAKAVDRCLAVSSQQLSALCMNLSCVNVKYHVSRWHSACCPFLDPTGFHAW